MPEEPEIVFSELTFRAAILDSISAHIAVLDSIGKILAVNSSWQEFADANRMDDASLVIGANYLDVCRSAYLDPDTRAVMTGILSVMRGHLPSFYHEYACHSPQEKRWFALRADPLIDYPSFVVVSHENITSRVLAEIANRPPEQE